MIEYQRKGSQVRTLATDEVQDFKSINKAKKFVRTIPQAYLKVQVIHPKHRR